MTVLKSYKINEYLTLKLEKLIFDGVYKKKTNIYVNGEDFMVCKYILFRNPHEDERQLEINSIDEAQQVLNNEKLEDLREKGFSISPEQFQIGNRFSPSFKPCKK